ncbi:MAG: hypothetical protein KF708_07655 [Pirellulales bacterium]|nr:hypothetical protein [Pirellulales bacterium]
MLTTQIDPEAKRLVIAIGVHVEHWVMNHARLAAERRPRTDGSPTVLPDDIREALNAFLRDGASDLNTAIDYEQGATSAS